MPPSKTPTFSLPVNTSKQIIRRKKNVLFSRSTKWSTKVESTSSFFLVQPNQPNQPIHQPNQSSQLHPISSTFPPGRWTPKSEPPAAVPETPPAPRSIWSKQTWILEGKNGRNRPEQVGMMWKNFISMKGFFIVKLEGRLVIPKIFSSQGYWICPFSVACQFIWRLLPQPPIIWGACAPAITWAPNVTVHCCNVDPVLTNSIWANRPFLHWWETSPTNPSIVRK